MSVGLLAVAGSEDRASNPAECARLHGPHRRQGREPNRTSGI